MTGGVHVKQLELAAIQPALRASEAAGAALRLRQEVDDAEVRWKPSLPQVVTEDEYNAEYKQAVQPTEMPKLEPKTEFDDRPMPPPPQKVPLKAGVVIVVPFPPPKVQPAAFWHHAGWRAEWHDEWRVEWHDEWRVV